MTTPVATPTIWTSRPAWFDHAACRGSGQHLFFPDQGDLYGARAAQAICSTCPVQADCLTHALGYEEHFGIWGGTTERDRRRLRGWNL